MAATAKRMQNKAAMEANFGELHRNRKFNVPIRSGQRPDATPAALWLSHSGQDLSRSLRCTLSSLRRKSVHQRQPVEAFAKPAREIVIPALGTQSTLLPDLLRGHAQDQNFVHQRRAVGAEFALGTVQPQHRLPLTLGNWLPHLAAIDVFPGRIHRPWSTLGLLPVGLKSPATLILCFIDMTMGVHAAQRVVPNRAQGND